MAASSIRASTLAHEAAVEATCLWLQGDHESCIQTLQRLELDHTLEDCQLQVQHNLAIVDHYSNNRREPSRLLDQLTVLLREATSKTSESPAPHASSRGAHGATVAIASQDAVAADDGTAVLKLNKALLLYQGSHYQEATQLLTPLLQHVDGLDEGTALHVLVLLLDMHLHQHHGQQAADVLTILEKTCLASSFATASLQQQQCSAAAAPPSSSPAIHTPQVSAEAPASQPLAAAGSHTLPFISNWGSATMVKACHLLAQRGHPIPFPPNVALLLKLYRVRLALLQQNIRAAKRELRAMVALDSAASASAGHGLGPSGAPGPGPGPSATLQQETEAAVLLQAAEALGRARAAANSPSPEPTSSGSEPAGSSGSEPSSGPRSGAGPLTIPFTSALLRAHIEVTRGSSRKAAHILSSMLDSGGGAATVASSATASSSDSDVAALRPVLLNDLGVVTHSSGKHQLSVLHFNQALQELGPTWGGPDAGSKGAEPGGREGEASYQEFAMLYNAGLQYAALGRYSPALSCLSRCVSASRHASGLAAHRPLLLLRAAEASINLHQQQRSASSARHYGAPAAPAGTSSSELPPSNLGPPHVPVGEPQALLHQALSWLQTASELLEPQRQQLQQQQQQQQQQESRPAAGSGVPSFPAPIRASPEDTEEPTDNHPAVGQAHTGILPAVLTQLAYVHLLLGERDAALAAAMQLLSMPEAAPEQVHVAACYAAEVLEALGRGSEAAEVMLQAQAAWAAGRVAASSGPRPGAGRDSHGEAAPRAGEGEGSVTSAEAAVSAVAVPAGGDRSEGDCASRAALCTNLAVLLVSQSAAPEAAELSIGSEGMASGPSALIAEARELQPGCQPASLLAAYLDMVSGRCNDALSRIREMQL